MSRKVLIVEDNHGFSTVLAREIRDLGGEVVSVNNGVDGVLRYLEGDIDLVLMDVIMPRLSGIDTLRILKNIDPGARILVFSGNASVEIREEALDLGAMEFLVKPFPVKRLLEIIKTA